MPDDQQPSAGEETDAEVMPAEVAPAEPTPALPGPVHVDTGYTESGVPTFDAVR